MAKYMVSASDVREILFKTAAFEIEQEGCVSSSALAKIMIGLCNRHIMFNNNFSAHYVRGSKLMIYKNPLTGERIVEPVPSPSERLVKFAKTQLLRVINSSPAVSDQMQKTDQSSVMKVKKPITKEKPRRSARLASRATDTMQKMHKRYDFSCKSSEVKHVGVNKAHDK